METDLTLLSPKERRMRRRWRICFFLYHVPLCLFFILAFVFVLVNDEGGFKMAILGLAGFTLAFLLPALIFYSCAFKRPGTFLLSIYLCVKPFDILIKGVGIYFLPFPGNIILYGILAFFAYFYFLSWNLRKINKKLRLSEKIYPDEYLSKITHLTTTTAKSDLDTLYVELMRGWPQFEKYSTHRYGMHLKTLDG